jgi:hypothetical protein
MPRRWFAHNRPRSAVPGVGPRQWQSESGRVLALPGSHVLGLDERQKPGQFPTHQPSDTEHRSHRGRREPARRLDAHELGRHAMIQLIAEVRSESRSRSSTTVSTPGTKSARPVSQQAGRARPFPPYPPSTAGPDFPIVAAHLPCASMPTSGHSQFPAVFFAASLSAMCSIFLNERTWEESAVTITANPAVGVHRAGTKTQRSL